MRMLVCAVRVRSFLGPARDEGEEARQGFEEECRMDGRKGEKEAKDDPANSPSRRNATCQKGANGVLCTSHQNDAIKL